MSGLSGDDVRIVMADHRVHTFETVADFRMNVNSGLVTFHYRDGEFGTAIHRLKYFTVTVPFRQESVAFSRYEVTVPGPGDPETEKVIVPDVIKDGWDTGKGLFMVFGRSMTAGFNLDHILFFRAYP
jgi:hypothetical protein